MSDTVAVIVLIVLLCLACCAFIRHRRRRVQRIGGCPSNVQCSGAPPVMPSVEDEPQDEPQAMPQPEWHEPEVQPFEPSGPTRCGWAPCSSDMYTAMPQAAPVLHRGPPGAGATECRTLQEVVNATQQQNAVVLMYATGCGPCNAFKPTYYQAATQARVPFYAVDAMAVPDLINRYNLVGFPSVFKFSNGRIVGEYSGNRTLGDLLMFASSN